MNEYEARHTREARYVWALDKLMPKITHLLNGAQVIRAEGMSRAQLRERYANQAAELRERAGDFPALLALHAELVARTLAQLPVAVTDEPPGHGHAGTSD